MKNDNKNSIQDDISKHQLFKLSDELAKALERNPIQFEPFKPVRDLENKHINSAIKASERIQAEKSQQMEIQKKLLETAEKISNDKIENPEKFIIDELYNVISNFEHRVVEIQSRGEVEISNDIYAAIRRIIEENEITIERESQVGRAKKKLGETDFYFFRYDDGRRVDLAVLENKKIEEFSSQYKQH